MKEYSGELYTASLFNRMKKNFVRIHNQFMYIYSNVYAQAPNVVVSMEKATVELYSRGGLTRVGSTTGRIDGRGITDSACSSLRRTIASSSRRVSRNVRTG